MKRSFILLFSLLAFAGGLYAAPTPAHLPVLHGYVMPVLRDARTGQIKHVEVGHNIITNTGKNDGIERLLNATGTPAIFNYIGVGNGSAGSPGTCVAEAATNTVLGNELGTRQQDGQATPDPPTTTGQQQLIVNFAAGNATGALCEVGIFNALTGATMAARKTFSVINKGATDTLEITYTLTLS